MSLQKLLDSTAHKAFILESAILVQSEDCNLWNKSDNAQIQYLQDSLRDLHDLFRSQQDGPLTRIVDRKESVVEI